MEPDDAPTSCATIEPLLAAYALGERDEGARAAIEAHLAACPACRRTMAAYRQVAGALPLGVAEAAPAPGLRARVVEAGGAAAGGPPRVAPPVGRGARQWQRAAWAAVALALAALLAWNLGLQRELARERAARDEQSAAVAALLASGRLERLPLTADSPGPTGELVLDPAGRAAALSVAAMPPLPPGMVYQLWLVRGDQRVSGGTFTVDERGAATLLVAAPEPLTAYQAVGVTVEPAGGSPGPTSPRVIGGALSS